jgi:hypothetical protein
MRVISDGYLVRIVLYKSNGQILFIDCNFFVLH